MKYISKNINLEKSKENIKQKGYSDKVKKYLSTFLLAAQVISVVPNIAKAHDIQPETQNSIQEVQNQDNKKDINFGYVDIDGKQKEVRIDTSNIYDADIDMDYVDIDGNKSNFNLKIDNSDKAIDDYGDKDEIDMNNIDEFASRGLESLQEKLKSFKNITWVENINNYTVGKMQQLKENNCELVFFSDATIEEIQNGTKKLDLLEAYSPDDMIMIKEHFEKYYGPIRDNQNLTQKEKFHAAMMVLSSLNTYDNEAYKLEDQTKYSQAAQFTSRNLYSTVKYGKTICAGYADSVNKICDMLGIENDSFNVLSCMSIWNSFSQEKQEEIIRAAEKGGRIEVANHKINSITFEDGSKYLLDMTNQDSLNEYIKETRRTKKFFKILFNRCKRF